MQVYSTFSSFEITEKLLAEIEKGLERSNRNDADSGSRWRISVAKELKDLEMRGKLFQSIQKLDSRWRFFISV